MNTHIDLKKINLYFVFIFAVLSILSACSGQQTSNQSNFGAYKKFNEHFAPLTLPYEMLTDNSSYSTFTALLDENRHIDSTFRHVFVLDSLTKEEHPDSVSHHTATTCCKFYFVGKVFETANYSAVLYARNNLPPNDDIYIFLATMDKEGKKIDEILFHKPVSTLPPTELKRYSIIDTDSSVVVSHLLLDYLFGKEKDALSLKKQILSEKRYQFTNEGKIKLIGDSRKEIPSDSTTTK
ncbi:hypothetical protein [Thermoflexibacter ruber]|uniref:Uncharacterized protein n=1 Tax=Thermoflexibacter ruber TaxID=1003 RepID=A0A1I2GGE3_9BACT|nr:hypothetical protein [Thermoflexibacter ruber]SFF15816.1 hypothetical protein SAMN04488541_101814 [Thermoflexibacter ruber]